eukprot:jgi/Tetstr1/447507/TSEL_034888.t1
MPAVQFNDPRTGVPRLLARLAESCAVGGVSPEALRRSAFALLLGHYEVEFPLVEEEDRSRWNTGLASGVSLTLLGQQRSAECARLEELCGDLCRRCEVLVIPEAADEEDHMLGAAAEDDVVALQHGEELLSMLLALQNVEAYTAPHGLCDVSASSGLLAKAGANAQAGQAGGFDLNSFLLRPLNFTGGFDLGSGGSALGSLGGSLGCPPRLHRQPMMQQGRETQAGAALEGHLLPPGAAFDLRSSSAARTGAPASPTQPLPGSASYAPSEAPSDTDGAASLVSFPGSERSGRSSASLAARLSSLSFEDALPGTATELTGGRQPAVPFSLLLSESESGSLAASVAGSVSASPRSSSVNLRFAAESLLQVERAREAEHERERAAEALSCKPTASRLAWVAADRVAKRRVATSAPLQRAPPAAAHVMSEASLVRLAVLAMQGVAAALQQLSAPRVATPTLGPAATAALLDDVIQAGARYMRLHAFVAQLGAPTLRGGGDPIRIAFAGNVRDLLSQHVASLQGLPNAVAQRRAAEGTLGEMEELPMTLMEVAAHTQALQSRMRALSVICMCEGESAGGFPEGADLLSYLYAQLCGAEWSTAPLLRALFAASMAPFLDFARKWMFTAEPLEACWSCREGPHLAALGRVPDALGLAGALPCAVPSFLGGVQYEFLMAGMQARMVARLPGGGLLLRRLRSVAEAEAAEMRRLADGEEGTAAPPSAPVPSRWFDGPSAADWFATGGSVPLLFSADALRSQSAVQERAAGERWVETKEIIDGMAERRRLSAAAAAAEVLRRMDEREQRRAEGRQRKAAEAAERRVRRAALLRAQKEAISEREAAAQAEREAAIREEQELTERAVRAEYATLLAEVAAQQAASASSMREADRRSKMLEWRSARWRLAAVRRSALQAIAAAEAAEMLEALNSRSRHRRLFAVSATPNKWTGEQAAPAAAVAFAPSPPAPPAPPGPATPAPAALPPAAPDGEELVGAEQRQEEMPVSAEGLEVELVETEEAEIEETEEDAETTELVEVELDVEEGEVAVGEELGAPACAEGAMTGATRARRRPAWDAPVRPFSPAGAEAATPPRLEDRGEERGEEEEEEETVKGGGSPSAGTTGAEAPMPAQAPPGQQREVLVPVQVAVDACIVQGLLRQYRCISHGALRILREEFGLTEYCKALAGVFFLQQGDLADLLCDGLRVAAEAQRALGAGDTQALLDAALRGSAGDFRLLEGSLALDIRHGRSLGRGPGAEPAKRPAAGLSRSALLQEGSLDGTDCLVLRHTPRWPMSAVVSPPAADAYADVFSMLLRLKRVIFAMQHSWRLLVARGGGSGGGMDPARLRQLQLFRHEAEHFAVNLQGYMHTQVMGAVWARFASAMRAAGDVAEVRAAHDDYLAAAAKSCLLSRDSRKLRAVVDTALQRLLDFRALLTCDSGETLEERFARPAAWAEAARIMGDFRNRSGFLYKVLRSGAGRGGHLTELFCSLDLNAYYSQLG